MKVSAMIGMASFISVGHYNCSITWHRFGVAGGGGFTLRASPCGDTTTYSNESSSFSFLTTKRCEI